MHVKCSYISLTKKRRKSCLHVKLCLQVFIVYHHVVYKITFSIVQGIALSETDSLLSQFFVV